MTNNRSSAMREVISREDALALIEEIPSIESLWITNEKEWEQLYGELAIALDIDKNQVENYITESIDGVREQI